MRRLIWLMPVLALAGSGCTAPQMAVARVLCAVGGVVLSIELPGAGAPVEAACAAFGGVPVAPSSPASVPATQG